MSGAYAQTTTEPVASWKRIGGVSVSRGLAAPATGPVQFVWFSASANRMFAQTSAGRVFETADFEHWRLNSSEAVPSNSFPSPPKSVVPAALPEPNARVQQGGTRLYATTPSNVYASDDNGRTWLNLTGFNNRSIIGGGFTALAVSPLNPQEIAAANQHGVWRSLDGGLSWHGLNDELPNLQGRRLLTKRIAALADGSLISYEAGAWTPLAGADPELSLRTRFSTQTGLRVSAITQMGSNSNPGTMYIGTADGQVAVSRDGGARWANLQKPASSGIDRIWMDADVPDAALAAAGNRLYRTINGGLFWDDVTGALPEARIHGVTADRSASIVYVATDRGVFSGTVPLNDASAAGSVWKPVSRDLPAAAAWDVRLNSDNTLTVALDGYGIYETPAPHRPRTVRIVNGADLSDRPAAPGSLITVLGANVLRGSTGALTYPVLAAGPRTSQLQVPFEAASGIFQLSLDQLSIDGSAATDRWSLPVTVRDAAPAIFVDGEGAPLLLDASSGLVVDPGVAIHAGSSVQILATGLGKVTPDWPTGVPAPLDAPPAVKGTVAAWLDGTPVQVTRATLAPGYVGYYIVELQIPVIVNRGTSELRIQMNGEESNRVKLYLESDRAAQ